MGRDKTIIKEAKERELQKIRDKIENDSVSYAKMLYCTRRNLRKYINKKLWKTLKTKNDCDRRKLSTKIWKKYFIKTWKWSIA